MGTTSSNELNEDGEAFHFVFPPEDMRSDGSDFGSDSDGMSISDGSSFVSRNYDMDADEVGPELVPPPPPRWEQMSVETLKELIEKEEQTKTVGEFLCRIDRDSDFYIPKYFETAEQDFFLDDPPPPRYMMYKTYYTMLGFACLDPDGERGEEKIKIILQTYKRLRREMIYLLVAFCSRFGRSNPDQDFKPVYGGQTTPPHLLIDNHLATTGSFKLICRAWPRVVHVGGDEEGTLLMYLVKTFSDHYHGEACIDLLKARTKVLLDAAENTKEGARGLILASDQFNEGVNSGEQGGPNLEELTVIHVTTTLYKNPEKVLPIFLKWWPECLKFIGEDIGEDFHDGPSYPFHNVFRRPSCKESVVKSFEVFVQYSTLDAMATALLYRDERRVGDMGFDLLFDHLEGPSLNADPDMKAYLGQVVSKLLHRRDEQGRTLLHYVMAHQVNIADWESSMFNSRFATGELKKKGRDIPNEWEDYHDDFEIHDMPEGLADAIEECVENHKLKMLADVATVAKWIISMDHALAFMVDKNGMNPFQFAVSKGKRWHNGLKELVKVAPKWADVSQSGTHFPFALAAESSHDYDDDDDGQHQLDTIFELLRFDASVLRFFTP